jgi:glycosyltransferase involved in cell wall biosynthesis
VRCIESICIASLNYQTLGFQTEVIVVDQSDAESDQWVGLPLRGVSVVRIKASFIGVSRARNLGIVNSRFPLIAFTDDDCIVDPDWLVEIGRMFVEQPEADAVFGRTEAIARTDVAFWHIEQPNQFGWDWHGNAENGDRCFATILRKGSARFTSVCLPFAQFGSSNNMACRRDVLHTIGIFSPWLGAGSKGISAEDTELQYRMLRLNKTIFYTERVRIRHDNWQSPQEAEEQLCRYLEGVSVVFAHFSLYGDWFAFRVLASRWSDVFRASGCYGILARLGSFLRGVAKGVWLHRKISKFPLPCDEGATKAVSKVDVGEIGTRGSEGFVL